MKNKTPKKFFILLSIVTVIIVFVFIFNSNDQNFTIPDVRIVDWRHVHGLGLDPADNSVLYIATHGDLYQSIGGAPPFKIDKVRADYMAFNAPRVSGFPLYASGHPSTGGNTGLIKSNDGGVTWEHVSNVIEPPVDFHTMAISKQNPEIIIGFDSGARGLFKTIDAGKTWKVLEYPEYIYALAISPNDSELIFTGTENGIFKSDDDGKTWIQLNVYQGMTAYALSFDDEGKLFASIETFGIVQSNNLGDSWENLTHVDLTVTSIVADSQSNEIYVGGYSSIGYQEVYKISHDGNSYELIGTNKGLK